MISSMKFAGVVCIASCFMLSDGQTTPLNDLSYTLNVEDGLLASASGFGYDYGPSRVRPRQPTEVAPDYPAPGIYAVPYRTGNCYGYPPGTTGDVETDCKTFEVCQSDGRLDFLYCPAYTRFNNYLGVCDWHWMVDQYCNPYRPVDYHNTAPAYAESPRNEHYDSARPLTPYPNEPASEYPARPYKVAAMSRPEVYINIPASYHYRPSRGPGSHTPRPYIYRSSARSEESRPVFPLVFRKGSPLLNDDVPVALEPAAMNDLTTGRVRLDISLPEGSTDRVVPQYRKLGYDQVYAPKTDSPYKAYARVLERKEREYQT